MIEYFWKRKKNGERTKGRKNEYERYVREDKFRFNTLDSRRYKYVMREN